MRKLCILVSAMALMAAPCRVVGQARGLAAGADNVDDGMDEWLRMPVRRLHTERVATGQRTKKNNSDKKQYKYNGHRYVPQKSAEQRAADAREKAHLDSLLAIDYTLPDYSSLFPTRLTWKDEPVKESREQLISSFNSTDLDGETRYVPKDVTLGNDTNALFFYFDVKNRRPQSLRLRAQYYADDPLGIEKLKFVIDGFDYYFTPSAVKKGSDAYNRYWENFDICLSSRDKDLVYALAHCSWARVTYIGDRGFNHVKILSKEQIKDFYNTLQLYRVMGGKL